MTASYPEIILAVCLLILPILYESSHVFRYYLKFFVYYSIGMINSVILLPVFCCRPRDVRNLLVASDFCRIVSTLVGLRWTIRGKENLEKKQACIILSNHQSSLDVLGIMEIWRLMDKCTVIAKRELLFAGPFGLASYLCGLIFIPRIQTDKAKNIMNEAANRLKSDKIKLWVFPEGTRRNDGKIHSFKKGAFHMAITNKLPIVPVVYSRYYFLDKTTKYFGSGNVTITALPQIETKDLSLDDLDELMERVRNLMSATYYVTSKEGLSSANQKAT
ncbi:unnamed protein product [Phaedon cochleariae]|uniref:1-acyl-sn-glycerol-3-phosphate acyltransferase n=1 Tax=Phaedon cochleariae TaxID=80249 RepID=A0A9N9SDR0_PHACE|nr:unnamed protein product [Phaedon cochleariae]